MFKCLVVVAALLALSSVGVAAPSSCDLLTYNCPGYGWGGTTNQVGGLPTTAGGGRIEFATDLAKRWVVGLEVAAAHESCVILPNNPIPIEIGSFGDSFRAQVVNGHFSGTLAFSLKPASESSARFPAGSISHVTGTLFGSHASGTIRWAFTGARFRATKSAPLGGVL